MSGAESLVGLRGGRVSEIELNAPPLNLFTRSMTAALGERLAEVEHLEDCRAVVVSGTGGRAFSAGSDISEFEDLAGRVGEGKLWAENSVFGRMARLGVPVIAAIEGVAFGSGLELALCCDLRVAGASSRFALPETGLGVIPGAGGTQRLARTIGVAGAKEMILLGEPIDAARAYEFGLLTRVVPDGSALETARALGERIASLAPIAIRKAKGLIDLSVETTLDHGLAAELRASETVFASQDLQEGVRAFFEKRPPSFQAE
jgi:enoyl-CoA hydratase/carnithine racemase